MAKHLAEKACQYLSASTDPFHAVANAVKRLEAAGFSKIRYNSHSPPTLEAGGKYYYTVQHSTLVAFTVGKQYDAAKPPVFHIIGGHTDSPTLKVKPRTKKSKKHGTVQLGVECYGGGLWHTFLDRDLSLSGKVLVREGDKVVPRLVQLGDPVARVSSLCIHLQSAEERRALTVNKEDHTTPIIGLFKPNKELEDSVQEQINQSSWHVGQEPLLLQRIAKELDVTIDKIADWEFSMYDTQPAAIGGMNQEFLYSSRLDNLATVFCAVEAMADNDPIDKNAVDMIVAFDHEEVGSTSVNGAGSTVMVEALQRVRVGLGAPTNPIANAQSVADSFCLSIDQAHAIHPNFAHKHESEHSPKIGDGIVIKTNGNQRYASSNTTSSYLVRELGRKVDVPIQEFVGKCSNESLLRFLSNPMKK